MLYNDGESVSLRKLRSRDMGPMRYIIMIIELFTGNTTAVVFLVQLNFSVDAKLYLMRIN